MAMGQSGKTHRRKGALTTVRMMARRLTLRWVPKWQEAFFDPSTGGFHERMGKGFQPIPVGYRRVLTQCRQLAVYAHAGRPDLDIPFQYIVQKFYVPDVKGWRFSIDESGAPKDGTYDLYAQAFVIFAMAHYGRCSGSDQARALALNTLSFIETRFRVEGRPGFVEALDENLQPMEKTRRHESHMHLFEACLFAYDVWSDAAFLNVADEMVALFQNYFYDPGKNILSEYYDDDLKPATENGKIVAEPGHACEWLWLLKKHAAVKGDPAMYDDVCVVLLNWANRHGWDETFGGIYDELEPSGAVINDTKRLWPFTEALKANALMLGSSLDRDEIKNRIAEMVQVFETKYMQERGFWTEWLSRDLTPQTDYMPGTTPYHVYFGIVESLEALERRGASKSWREGVLTGAYMVRRFASDQVRKVRMGLKSFKEKSTG